MEFQNNLKSSLIRNIKSSELLEQPFVKDNSTTFGEMITAQIAKMGENITVSRIARFKVGEVSS